jgi:3'-phosphoadenosine 5'-phosphosulfate sulfotransferase (PAPS reductase)/FAD synthetase
MSTSLQGMPAQLPEVSSNVSAMIEVEQAREILSEAVSMYRPEHVFIALSGGNDSMAIAHLAAELLQNRSRIQVVHINTGIGIPEANAHVKRVCGDNGWELTEIRAKEDCGQDYDQLVLAHGFPGPDHHTKMYNRLKERCLRYLGRGKSGKVMLISGLRQQESARRMRLKSEPVQRDGRRIWVAPAFFWTKDHIAEYRALHDIPESPVSQLLCMSGECLCGAYAPRGQLKEVEFFFPAMGKRLRDLQSKVWAAGFPWGWDEGPPSWWVEMKRAEKHGQADAFKQEQKIAIRMMCSSCEFRAKL